MDPAPESGSSHRDPEQGEQPPGADPLQAPHRQKRMRALARGMDLYLHIEDLCQEWLETVCGPDLSQQEAILALLAGLRGGLQPDHQTDGERRS